MHLLKCQNIALAAVALFLPSLLNAEDAASWLRTRVSNALNPKISVIGDFVAQAGPGPSNDLSMREVEVAIQSEVDPNTRADFFLALHDGESMELEEGYITLLSLPLGFQARGGKILAVFGRLNTVHDHELPQVDRPQALTDLLGEHGINGTGFEASRVFNPFGIFTEVTYGFLEALSSDDHGHEDDAATADIIDVNGSTVTVAIHEDEAEDSNRTLRDFANVGRVRFFKDITDASNIELGFSGANYHPEVGDQVTFGGLDLTFRWKPLREGLYKSFIWRTEAVHSKRKLPAEFDATGALVADKAEFERSGGYSYVEGQLTRRLRLGVRGDYVENPEGAALEITRAVIPYVTIFTSEFNRYRIQYRYRDLPLGAHDHAAYLQWTVVLGPHGAHPY